jgi:lantibiotic modifying enzyme
MDDVLENAFSKLASYIRDSCHAQVQAIIPSSLQKSTYLYPEYVIRIVCKKEVVSFLVEAVFRYCIERFHQPGLEIIMKKNGKEIDLLRAPNPT